MAFSEISWTNVKIVMENDTSTPLFDGQVIIKCFAAARQPWRVAIVLLPFQCVVVSMLADDALHMMQISHSISRLSYLHLRAALMVLGRHL